jgi:rubrerythrin
MREYLIQMTRRGVRKSIEIWMEGYEDAWRMYRGLLDMAADDTVVDLIDGETGEIIETNQEIED